MCIYIIRSEYFDLRAILSQNLLWSPMHREEQKLTLMLKHFFKKAQGHTIKGHFTRNFSLSNSQRVME